MGSVDYLRYLNDHPVEPDKLEQETPESADFFGFYEVAKARAKEMLNWMTK